MLRILHVVTYMGRGGLETMLMNYYRKIDRTKVQFDFLVHRDFKADYDENILRLGGKIYHLPVLNPFSFRYRRALSVFFAEHSEYEIIHVHQDCLSSIILKEAKKHNVRVRIAHSHNANQDRNVRYLIKLYYRSKIPRFATRLMACSQDAGNWMFKNAPFEVLNNAIDAQEYRFATEKKMMMRDALGITNSQIVVGHVGRFNPQKNHSFLLEIFAEFKKKCNDSVLLLIGDGEQRAMIQEKVKCLGLIDSVIFTGVRTDVDDLLQAMDVFVFPSNYEGLPVTIIEAQAAGLPCLISEKVPIECKKTNLVHQITLDAGLEVWADAIISVINKERVNTYEEIKMAGYDIVENAKRLQEFYLALSRGEENICLY